MRPSRLTDWLGPLFRRPATDPPVVPPAEGPEQDATPPSPLLTIAEPAWGRPGQGPRRLIELGDAPAPEDFAYWLETVIALERSAADPPEVCRQTAQAMVDLVGLDQGMVLLGQDGQVEVAACHTASDKIAASYSRTLVKKVMREGRTFFENVAAMALEAESLRSIAVALVSPIFGLRDEVIGVLYGTRVWRGTGPITIRPIDAHVVQLLAATIGAHLTRTAALRTRFQFEQFFSAELVRELERNPDLLEGREQEVTILVSDLRDSTQIVERADAVTSCRLVRDVMERLTDCIAAEGGVVVDYAGDGILAMWNAPVEQPDHPERACRAALAMLAEVPALNQHWQAVIGQPLRLGIGINTGTARVGNTGSSHKVKYGPHGRTVNLASRIEGVTKRLGLSLLITDTTQARLPASWPAKRLGRFELRGIAEEVVLYELAEEDSSSQPEQQPDGNSAESRG